MYWSQYCSIKFQPTDDVDATSTSSKNGFELTVIGTVWFVVIIVYLSRGLLSPSFVSNKQLLLIDCLFDLGFRDLWFNLVFPCHNFIFYFVCALLHTFLWLILLLYQLSFIWLLPYNCLSIPTATESFCLVFHTRLPITAAALAMTLASFSVVINSLALYVYQPP